MHTTQRILSGYQRRRVIVCILLAALVGLLTLAAKYFSELRLNEQRVDQFNQRAVLTVESLLAPFEQLYKDTLPLISLSCENAQQTLREFTAKVPTIRSISLVKNGVLYCSSVFGTSQFIVRDLQPQMPSPEPRLLLGVDHLINKGSSILLSWHPISASPNDGIVQVINLGMLTAFMQHAEGSWITRTILNISGSHFEYTQGLVNDVDMLGNEIRHDTPSQNYPFSITTVGPSPSSLAIDNLPSHLPLAAVISLLAGVFAWFMTAKRMSFSHEIKMGLASREFEVYFQPLIHSDNQQCIGIELLLRWDNPRHGSISPDVFIPLAEQQNLIIPLTCYVLRETVGALDQFPKMDEFHISINVAACHFKDNIIIKDLRRYWFPAHPQQQLVLELTEREALPIVDHHVVRELHHLNIKLAIDDFGSGQSSLAYLETLRPDILKIDKSYIGAIGTDAVNSKVTDIIIALGHRLDIELIAEGVETAAQAAFLRQQDVKLLQGFFFARPMPLKHFPAWLEMHNRHLSSQ
ncbi:EAL domain-containing protein [Citrobacter sp. JGM124]|uniref:EAL domain-containing protein n=1 Tax=Citrobacter sp. JGM124 TaxID=2799789 RepID=UPI001BAA821B|nr:EAL domain-containing protein [Citrobacter sp. JGM124]MBS0847112.1 EAL domain-containing protein [Citrobacter sp. JGM124]